MSRLGRMPPALRHSIQSQVAVAQKAERTGAPLH
jgi:hypothetical protein